MRRTMREMQDAKRDEALATIRDQVRTGTLTVRQMTDEERARYSSAGSVTQRSGRAR
jgi:hypothetical protein